MHDLQNFFASNEGIGFLVATAIFLITVLFVAKRLIGFFVTLLFLLFALAAGLLISNQDLVRTYLKGYTGSDSEMQGYLDKKQWEKSLKDTLSNLKEDWQLESEDQIAFDDED